MKIVIRADITFSRFDLNPLFNGKCQKCLQKFWKIETQKN